MPLLEAEGIGALIEAMGAVSTGAVALAVTLTLAGTVGTDVAAALLIPGAGRVALGVGAGAVALGAEGSAGLDELGEATGAAVVMAGVAVVASGDSRPKFRSSELQPASTTVPSRVAKIVGDRELRDSISERVIFFTGFIPRR